MSAAPADAVTPRGRRQQLAADVRLQRVALALVILAGTALTLWANRGTWFVFDDWDFLVDRGNFSQAALLGPQNQNLYATTPVLFQLSAHLFGVGTYLPLRLLAAGVFALIGWLTAVYAGRRVGPWWAIVATAVVLVTPGWEIVTWPLQIGQLISIASGLGTLVLLDAVAGRRRRRQLLAAALLLLAVLSSSAGIPVLLVVLADRLLTTGRRREALVAAPALLFYVWWLQEWGSRNPNPNQGGLPGINAAVRAAIDTGDGAMQFLLGVSDHPLIGSAIAQLALMGLVVLVCWRLFGPHPAERTRILALTAGLAAYWALLSYGRASSPGYALNSRYLLISHVLLVWLLVAVGSSLRLQAKARTGIFAPRTGPALGGAIALGVLVVAAYAAVQSAQHMDRGALGLRAQGQAVRAEAAALAVLSDAGRARAIFQVDPGGGVLPRDPQRYYFDLYKRYGTALPTEADLKALQWDSLQYADATQLLAYSQELAPGVPAPAPAKPAPSITAVAGALPVKQRVSGGCVAYAGDATTVVGLDRSAPLRITNTGPTPLQLEGRRYARDWRYVIPIQIAPGATRIVRLEADRGKAPWELRLIGAPARICDLNA